jgi:hypothetical protein
MQRDHPVVAIGIVRLCDGSPSKALGSFLACGRLPMGESGNYDVAGSDDRVATKRADSRQDRRR